MALQFDVLGFIYDDSEPAFTLLKGNEFYYHIKTGKLYGKASFDAFLTANSKSFGSKELGVPSAAWTKNHHTIIERTGTVPTTPPPASTAITVTAALGALTVTCGGGPLGAGDPDQITVRVVAGSDDVSKTVTLAAGTTAAQAASAVAAETWTPFTATAAGPVVTFAKGTAAAAIATLTATVA